MWKRASGSCRWLNTGTRRRKNKIQGGPRPNFTAKPSTDTAEGYPMWLRKLSWRMCGWILAGLLVGGIVSHALWPSPPFSFLRGCQPVRADDVAIAYELSGDPWELSRKIDHELITQGFKRLTEERWSKGRKVKYRSADEVTQVFLVSEADPARPVSFWIRSLRGPSRLSMIGRDILNLLTFTMCHWSSPVNACIANLSQIDGAQATWALENPKRTNEIPSDADLFGPQAYVRVKPECPSGGRYTRGNIGEHPHCSIPWHDLD
jgi:hypothetical protein